MFGQKSLQDQFLRVQQNLQFQKLCLKCSNLFAKFVNFNRTYDGNTQGPKWKLNFGRYIIEELGSLEMPESRN